MVSGSLAGEAKSVGRLGADCDQNPAFIGRVSLVPLTLGAALFVLTLTDMIDPWPQTAPPRE